MRMEEPRRRFGGRGNGSKKKSEKGRKVRAEQ